MIEKEFKIMLSDSEYKNLLHEIIWDDSFKQKNSYYDTSNFELNKRDTSFRIREKDRGFKIQIKCKDTSPDFMYKEKIEYAFPIDNVPVEFTTDNCQAMGLSISSRLCLLGSLITTRYVKKINGNITLFLDKSVYFNKTDYELEIEFKEESDIETMLKTIKQYDLALFKSEKSEGKYSRFLKEYIKENTK